MPIVAATGKVPDELFGATPLVIMAVLVAVVGGLWLAILWLADRKG